eukprot:12176182-Alexandrium_andersonii.AAC.1
MAGAGGAALRAARPALRSAPWGLRISVTPSRGEGPLARLASWDCDLPGWIFGPVPILDRRSK